MVNTHPIVLVLLPRFPLSIYEEQLKRHRIQASLLAPRTVDAAWDVLWQHPEIALVIAKMRVLDDWNVTLRAVELYRSLKAITGARLVAFPNQEYFEDVARKAEFDRIVSQQPWSEMEIMLDEIKKLASGS